MPHNNPEGNLITKALEHTLNYLQPSKRSCQKLAYRLANPNKTHILAVQNTASLAETYVRFLKTCAFLSELLPSPETGMPANGANPSALQLGMKIEWAMELIVTLGVGP